MKLLDPHKRIEQWLLGLPQPAARVGKLQVSGIVRMRNEKLNPAKCSLPIDRTSIRRPARVYSKKMLDVPDIKSGEAVLRQIMALVVGEILF